MAEAELSVQDVDRYLRLPPSLLRLRVLCPQSAYGSLSGARGRIENSTCIVPPSQVVLPPNQVHP